GYHGEDALVGVEPVAGDGDPTDCEVGRFEGRVRGHGAGSAVVAEGRQGGRARRERQRPKRQRDPPKRNARKTRLTMNARTLYRDRCAGQATRTEAPCDESITTLPYTLPVQRG